MNSTTGAPWHKTQDVNRSYRTGGFLAMNLATELQVHIQSSRLVTAWFAFIAPWAGKRTSLQPPCIH